jgi:hypothetical protein
MPLGSVGHASLLPRATAFGAAKFSYINDLPANQAQSLPNLYD